MPTYRVDAASPVLMTPIDPNAVVSYSWDWTLWLDGATIVEFEVIDDTNPTIAAIGDGVTQAATTSVGNVTPGVPTEAGGLITAWIWATATKGTILLRARVRASDGRIDDRSMKRRIKTR